MPAGPSLEVIRSTAQRYGVDPGLVSAVIQAESGGNPHAVSPKGAQGLMQLMPSTAEALGVKDPFDPTENLDGGVRHLGDLLTSFNGDLASALAAYNAGEAAVRAGRIPPETQAYVRKVMGLYQASRQAAFRRPVGPGGVPLPGLGLTGETVYETRGPRDDVVTPAPPAIPEARRPRDDVVTRPEVGAVAPSPAVAPTPPGPRPLTAHEQLMQTLLQQAVALPRPDPAELAAIPQRWQAIHQGEAKVAAQYEQLNDAYLRERSAHYRQYQEDEAAYRAAMQAPPPELPKLVKLPETPNITVRPWLVPEGRQNLSTILQGLSALAVAFAGVAVGAPRNALQYFYTAAESWRRDQIDQGNAAFKNFQAEMQIMKTENDQRLEIYNLASRRFGANQTALHAAVVTDLEAVGQTDQAFKTASVGLDHQLKLWQQARQDITTTQQGVKDFLDGEVKLATLAEKINTQKPERSLAEIDYKISQNPPPDELARLQWMRGQLMTYKAWEISAPKSVGSIDNMDRAAQNRIRQREALDEQIQKTWDAMKRIHTTNPHLFPATPSTVDGWFASVQQLNPANWQDPQVQADMGVLKQFLVGTLVEYDRTQMEVKGNATKAIYGMDLEHPIKSFDEMAGKLVFMRQGLRANNVSDQRHRDEMAAERDRALTPPGYVAPPGAGYGGEAPGPTPSAPTE
jgi:hypothetical protein